MPVHNEAANEAEGHGGSHLVTEAEALCSLLGDLGVIPAINLTNRTVYVTTSDTVKAGAIEVLQVIASRAADDEAFCEDVTTAIGNCGFYLSDAPAVNAALKTAPALHLIQALGHSGLLVRHHYERNDEQTPMLSFMPVPGQPVGANAHMLMVLAVNRFGLEPDFAADMTRYIVNAGRSQHNA